MIKVKPQPRIGIDLGGTKIEAILMDPKGKIIQTERLPTPKDSYSETLFSIAEIIQSLSASDNLPIGIGTPGAISLLTDLMKNCNSTFLNGMNFQKDLEKNLVGGYVSPMMLIASLSQKQAMVPQKTTL